MRKTGKVLTAVATLLILVVCVNYAFAYRHLQAAANGDPRNEGITALAYQQWLVNPRVVVVDVWGVDGERSMLDVTRLLLSFSSRMKDRELDRIVLAYRGSPRFYLDGEYFTKLGREYGEQNPVYTLRTLPENVKRMDGTSAYGSWSGGLLGVVGRQMEDLNTFHRQWWLDSVANRQR